MKAITMYEAENGRIFSTEVECLDYEQHGKNAEEATEMLANGFNMMDVLTKANQSRPLWDRYLTIDDRRVLGRATKDTLFAVYKWNVDDAHMCKVYKIENNGYMMLQGHNYGAYVSLADLLCYAHQTDAESAAQR